MAGLTLTRMAVRELWISFRLLLLLTLPIAVGLLALLAPSDSGITQPALAWGLAGVATAAAGVAAAAWASERRRGTAGWLSLRAVPRASILIAWFAGLALPVMVGTAAGALLVWLATGVAPSPPLDALSYASLVGATAAAGLQALAIGILFGSFLRPIGAAVLAVVASGALLVAGLLVSPEPPLVPTAGLGLLAQATYLMRPLADGLQALGIGLTLTGLLLGASLLIFNRVDL
jgi:ABC-type transport system involved in multi-copper enzyme maturation permease subunit